MATNRDLLKEAIADAKAVKETAIANAKAALEEAFTPFLKEKLASKIAEMDEVEELELVESEVSEVEKEMDEIKKSDDMAEEVSLDELLAELEEEESMEEAKDKKSMDETYMDEDSMYEAKGEEEEMNIEDMSEDDLKSFIEDVIKDMVASGELEAGESMEGEEGGEEMEMDMEAGAEEEVDEDINLDELLAEMDEAYGKKAKAKGSLASTKGKDEYVTDETEADDATISKGKAEKVSFKEEQIEEAEPVMTVAQMLNDPTAWGLVAALLGLPTLAAGGAKAQSTLQNLADKGNQMAKKALGFLTSAGKSASSGIKETDITSEELDEAYSTIEELRNELNEINLLNAKLLYTNKIFRNKSLTETQKVNVLTAFDKATTKKEVELVYNTLTESLKASATKAPIKESLGSASKVLGGATSKPIIENDAFSRMRELAFGNKK